MLFKFCKFYQLKFVGKSALQILQFRIHGNFKKVICLRVIFILFVNNAIFSFYDLILNSFLLSFCEIFQNLYIIETLLKIIYLRIYLIETYKKKTFYLWKCKVFLKYTDKLPISAASSIFFLEYKNIFMVFYFEYFSNTHLHI